MRDELLADESLPKGMQTATKGFAALLRAALRIR